MVRFDVRPQTWDEVHAGYSKQTVARTKWLRSVVASALPQCTESVQGARMMGYAHYWQESRQDVLAMISPEDEMVKLYIHHVRKDATGRLKVEGTGKHARHVKLWLDQEYDEEDLRNLLAQVVAARESADP